MLDSRMSVAFKGKAHGKFALLHEAHNLIKPNARFKEATLRVDGHFHCDLSIDSKDLHRHIRHALTFDG